MSADRPSDAWRAANRRAAERADEIVERALGQAASRAWGRGLFRPPWQIVRDLDSASWRAYRYVGSLASGEHRYYEFGVVCHVDPDGNLVGFGVDNGVDFMGLHDTTEYGLRRGLDYILKQPPRIRSYDRPLYEHKLLTIIDEQ